MRVLITGGAGYAGTALARQLLTKGYFVRVLDNFLYGSESILHLLHYPDFEPVRADIRSDLRPWLRDIDLVFHLAAISGFPACKANPAAAEEINVGGTRNLIKHLAAQQVLVYASTTSLYGDKEGVCTEDSPLRPVSNYGRTKLAAEELVMQRGNSLALRLATIFGVSSRMRSDLLVNEFVWRAIHDRNLVLFDAASKRTFVHLNDAVRAYELAAAKADTMTGRIYNVGSAQLSVSKYDVAEAVRCATGCAVLDSSVPDLDRRDFRISFAKLEALGFKTEVTLEQGIAELVRYYTVCNPKCFYQVI